MKECSGYTWDEQSNPPLYCIYLCPGEYGLLLLYDVVLMQLFLVYLHFVLSDAPFWTEDHAEIDYHDLYKFIVDYFKVPEGQKAKAHVKKLLAWWNK